MRRRVAVIATAALALAMSPMVAVSSSAASTGAGGGRAGARSAGAAGEEYEPSLCQQRPFMCMEPYHSIGENGAYTGHDEPFTQFLSHRSGSGGGDPTHVVRRHKK